MAYDVYIDDLLCPVAPSKISTKIKGKNKTITLINQGEVNVLKKPGLSELTFDLLLPNVEYPFANYKDGFQNARVYLDKLEELAVSRKPFQFIVTRALPDGTVLFDTDIKVSLESYDIKEDKSEGHDIVVSVKLKQYRDYGTQTAEVKKPSTASKPAKVTTKKKRPTTSTKITKGCNVIVNGTLHRDSYGAGPGQSRHNYKGKVNFIVEGRKCPYHVTTPSGGWLGWVYKSAVKRVK